jgi:hypothetical protein
MLKNWLKWPIDTGKEEPLLTEEKSFRELLLWVLELGKYFVKFGSGVKIAISHNSIYWLCIGNVFQGIGIQKHQVSHHAFCNASLFIFNPEKLRRAESFGTIGIFMGKNYYDT